MSFSTARTTPSLQRMPTAVLPASTALTAYSTLFYPDVLAESMYIEEDL